MTANDPRHIGIDLAWGPKNRTGLAAVAADGRLLASGSAHRDEEILTWIADHASALGVVAIDAPLIVTNATGRRHCEALIHTAFGRFDAGPHSTNLSKPEFNPPRGAVLAERLGLPLDPDGRRDGVAIEVYPHPAMVGLWDLDLILKYKHKAKYAFRFRKSQFSALLAQLNRVESLGLEDVPRWAEIEWIVEGAAKHGDLNRIEDEVDGIVCAYLAWLWAQADARLTVYGDVTSGYIVAPHPPAHPARSRLDRVSSTRPVRFEGRSLNSGTQVDAAPAFALDGPTGRWMLTPDEAHELELVLRTSRMSE